MLVSFQCPQCQRTQKGEWPHSVNCAGCDWHAADRSNGDQQVDRCLICGNQDLWRQKDFSPRWGLAIVCLGAVLSSMAWYYHRPVWALGLLLAFALMDMILFFVMPDVLVCYRCRARHHRAVADESHQGFNHELAERYRQEAKRLQDTQSH